MAALLECLITRNLYLLISWLLIVSYMAVLLEYIGLLNNLDIAWYLL